MINVNITKALIMMKLYKFLNAILFHQTKQFNSFHDEFCKYL